MTDGGVYYDANGNELKKFAIKDGAGIVLAHAAGMQVMICTGRECEAVRRRAAELKVEYCTRMSTISPRFCGTLWQSRAMAQRRSPTAATT